MKHEHERASDPTAQPRFGFILPDEFMKHFRWITPLLLLFLNLIAGLAGYIGYEFLQDFKEMKLDLQRTMIEVARIEGHLEDGFQIRAEKKGP